jgi:RHS repeat-associated protein
LISFVRADHIGRPVFATNATGVKVWTATYTPFGGVHTSTGSLPEARFPGQWFQSESGLHQNWMRDYDPTTGRYLEAGPLGLVDGASVYGYVGQNPGRWIDPRGEQTATMDGPMSLPKGVGGGTALGEIVSWCASRIALPLALVWPNQMGDGTCNDQCSAMAAEHTKGARPSTKARHEEGEARRDKDYGREKGDEARGPPRKPPPGYKGPWPPKGK